MAVCKSCGAELQETEKFCSQCGTEVSVEPVVAEATAEQVVVEEKKEEGGFEDAVNKAVDSAQDAFEKFTDTKDTTEAYSETEIKDGVLMGILSYLAILVLIPIFVEKDNKFVRFHANQGLILFILSVAVGVVHFIISLILSISILLFPLRILFGIVFFLAYAVLIAGAVLGIVNVCTGKAKELPLVGRFKVLK